MTIAFKGSHFERDVILWGVRWYVAYPISYRQIEEMMGERGVEVDHSTLHRWVLKYVQALEKAFLARKRPVGGSWQMDETYVKRICQLSHHETRSLVNGAAPPSSGLHDVERNSDAFDEAGAAEGGGDDLVMTAARTE